MVAPVSDQQQSAAGHAACWALVEGRPGASVRSGTWSLALSSLLPVGRPRSLCRTRTQSALSQYEGGRVASSDTVSDRVTFLGTLSSTSD